MSRSRLHPFSLLATALAALSIVFAGLTVVPASAAGPDPTTTNLTVTPDQPVYGEDSITLTAEVMDYETGQPVIGGTVTFTAMLDPAPGGPPSSSDPVALGSDPVDGAGVAEITRMVDYAAIPGLLEGQAFSVTATYEPASAAYLSSESTSVVVEPVAPPGPATTTTTVSAPSSATVGDPVELNASVSPAEAGGTMQFYVVFDGDEDQPIGQPVPVADGSVATLSYAFDEAGEIEAGAIFTAGNSSRYLDSRGSTVVVVSLAESEPPQQPTTTTVTAPASAKVGRPVSLAATVGPANDGTVQFYVDDTPVGAPVAVVVGTATLSHTFAAASSARVSAVFSPIRSDVAGSRAPYVTVQVTRTQSSVRVTSPATATAGQAVDLTASVSPSDAAGTVQFAVDGSPAGSPVTVGAGTVSQPHTFATGGAHTVTASFTPTDPTVYDGSADSAGLVVTTGSRTTTVEVTGPPGATAGEPATLSASVRPVAAGGTVTFVVNGEEAGTADVDADTGAASTPYTFTAAGQADVVATFEPSDTSTYRSTSTSGTVDVEAGTTAESPPGDVSTEEVPMEFNYTCPFRSDSRRGFRDGEPLFPFGGFTGIQPFLGSLFYNQIPFLFRILSQIPDSIVMVYRYDPCFGGRGDARGVAASRSGTVQCLLTETGYQCPFYLGAFSRLTVSFAVPMPAALAGKRVDLQPSLSMVDPVNGSVTTVQGDVKTVKVPKRTVLSARMAPVNRDVGSVHRGKAVTYRVRVGNEGVVTADGVRTCVRVGPGATVRTAHGATVRGQRACWTLPSLTKGESVIRKLTVVAPRTRGDLVLQATVTPKKTQADVVRVTAALPVR